MLRRLTCTVSAAAVLLAGCGSSAENDRPERDFIPAVTEEPTPSSTAQPPRKPAVSAQGSVTKNTSRLAGEDPAQDAAAVALAAFPSRAEDLRPRAVAIADRDNWQAAISASVLMSRPVQAPLLLSAGGNLRGAGAAALRALEPTGAPELEGARVVTVGDDAARPRGEGVTRASGKSPAAIGAAIDDLVAQANANRSRAVIVAGSDAGAAPFSMPAAGLSAKTGAPVLWTGTDELSAPTVAQIRKRRSPRIYVVGPPEAVSGEVVTALRKLGDVKRIDGADPAANAVAVARFSDRGFGWNLVDPGHGLVFAASNRPADAGAAAPLSASGTYGPLLLVEHPDKLPRVAEEFLLDIQPGFDDDPARGVYNHAWIIGGSDAVSSAVQARIDGLLEIQPVDRG